MKHFKQESFQLLSIHLNDTQISQGMATSIVSVVKQEFGHSCEQLNGRVEEIACGEYIPVVTFVDKMGQYGSIEFIIDDDEMLVFVNVITLDKED